MPGEQKLTEKFPTLPDLAEFFAAQGLSFMLTEGGKGLERAMFLGMHTAIRWREEVAENEKKSRRKARKV